MKKDRDQLIAARAYQLWEEEGRPHGAHERHWDQAAREVMAAGPVKSKARVAAKRKTMAVKAGKPAVSAKAKTPAKPKAKAATTSAGAAKDGAGGKRAKPS